MELHLVLEVHDKQGDLEEDLDHLDALEEDHGNHQDLILDLEDLFGLEVGLILVDLLLVSKPCFVFSPFLQLSALLLVLHLQLC